MSSNDLAAKKAQAVKIPLPYSKTKVLQLPKIRIGDVTPDKMNPVTTDFKINSYYNTMMRDHFLFERENGKIQDNEISVKLRQRLQNRVNLHSTFRDTSRTPNYAHSVIPSPRDDDNDLANLVQNRLTEMKNAQKPQSDQRRGLMSPQTVIDKQQAILVQNKASFAAMPHLKHKVSGTAPPSPRAKKSGIIEEQMRENMQTFYMIEAKEFMNQKRLGEITLSKKENILEKGQLLYDATKVMQMTQGYLKKNLLDLMKKRKWNEAQSSKFNSTNNEAVREAQRLREQFTGFNPDEGLPEYLKDRRHELYNPLKENKITFTEMRVINKMKKMGLWNEELMGSGPPPADGQPQILKKIDSLVESVFNSEKNFEWLPESGCPVKAPPPSVMSESDINIYDSRADFNEKDEADWMFANEKSIPSGDQNKDDPSKLALNPAESQTMDIKPEQSIIKMLQKEDKDMKKLIGGDEEDNPDDYFDAVVIDGIQLASIKHLGPYKVIQKSKDQAKKLKGKEPNADTLGKIYRHYCNMVHLVPVPFLHLYKQGFLKLPNFNLQAGLSLALACVIPYMIDLIGVKFVSNGIRDDEAAMLIRACSFCPNFKSFILERNEVGEKFAYMMKEGILILQEKFQELSLAQSRNFMKISSKVGLISAEASLHHLDLSNNTMNYLACKLLGSMIKNTNKLELLNLANCGLRNTSAREIVNAMLFNQTVKFLNLSVNSFASKDYEMASKLARMIQIHQVLIHLDLTSIQLRREEAMYIAQCLNDSSNIVCCHLTGNNIDYYGRLFLRAHINAIVQFPMLNNQGHQTNVQPGDRGQIGSLNNQIQMTINERGGHQYMQEKAKDPEYYMDLIAKQDLQEGDIERIKRDMEAALEEIGNEEDRQRESTDETPIRGRRRILSSMESETLSQQKRAVSLQPIGVQSQPPQQGIIRQPTPTKRLSKFAQAQVNGNISGQGAIGTLTLPNEPQRPRGTSLQPIEGGPMSRSKTRSSKDKKDVASMRGQSMLYRYLKDKESHIYDMFSMLDTYGFKKQVEEAKQSYLKKFPDTELAEQFKEEEKKLKKLKSNKTSSLLMDQGLSTQRTNNQPQWTEAGTLSDQNAMARFIGGLVTYYDEKLPPHPMQGFLNEVIFSRFIGHDDIENSHSWRDCSQCWICEKWDKCGIQYYDPDIIDDSSFQKVFEISQTFQDGTHLTKLKRPDDGKKKVKVEEKKDDQAQKIFEGDEYLIKPSAQVVAETQSLIALDHQITSELRSVVDVRTEGLEKIEVFEVLDKVLFNQQINPMKLDLKSFQSKIVPTIAILKNGTESQQKDLVVHQNCIPYIPFTKKAVINALNSTCTPLNESALSVTPIKDGLNVGSVLGSSIHSGVDSRKLSSQKLNKNKSQSVKKDVVKQSLHSDEGSSVENWSEDSDVSKTSLERGEIEKNRMKFHFGNIFTEWWKILPEVTAYGEGQKVDDIYVMASFNNWLPMRMEAWEKKVVLVQDQAEREAQTAKVKEQLKNLLIPQNVLQAHIEKKYGTNQEQSTDKKENEKDPDETDSQLVRSNSDSESEKEQSKRNTEPTMYRTLINLEEEKKYDPSLIKCDIAYNHSKFVPSGRHFFYFIKHAKYYCLSDRYPIKKFKQTNLYMNEIVIHPRTWQIQDFDLGEVLGVKKKAKFDISKSIFKTWKVETPDLLSKMFELDFKYTKIKKVFKTNNSDCDAVKQVLEKHYVKIKNIFLGQVLNSEYPIVSWNDFTIMCNKCKIADAKHCNLATIDRIYIATNVNQNIQGQQGDRDLVRYEFLEIILRIANAKYKESGICTTSAIAVQKLLDDNIFPNLEEIVPQDFRENQLYTDEVNELLVKNEPGLKRLFGLYCHGQKKYMTVKDTFDMINSRGELRFLEKQIIKQFGLAKMPHLDQIVSPEFPTRIIFIEFLEFLGRMSFEYFKEHAGMKDEPLHLKYDAILTKLFKLVKYNKTFTFLEPQRQNVVYEVQLNPQLLGGAGMERQPSQEKIAGLLNSDLDKIRETEVKFNL